MASLGAVVEGTGFGCLTHVRALQAAGFDVLAVVGRDPERTALRARVFEVPRVTFVDGVADMVVLDAIRRAAAERCWVAVEPV